MRVKIDGYYYDTNTATCIGTGGTDFVYPLSTTWLASLYKTPRGKYFLCGNGGYMTRYAHSKKRKGTWHSGPKIDPMAYEEAKRWAREHLEQERYEKEFIK